MIRFIIQDSDSGFLPRSYEKLQMKLKTPSIRALTNYQLKFLGGSKQFNGRALYVESVETSRERMGNGSCFLHYQLLTAYSYQLCSF